MVGYGAKSGRGRLIVGQAVELRFHSIGGGKGSERQPGAVDGQILIGAPGHRRNTGHGDRHCQAGRRSSPGRSSRSAASAGVFGDHRQHLAILSSLRRPGVRPGSGACTDARIRLPRRRPRRVDPRTAPSCRGMLKARSQPAPKPLLTKLTDQQPDSDVPLAGQREHDRPCTPGAVTIGPGLEPYRLGSIPWSGDAKAISISRGAVDIPSAGWRTIAISFAPARPGVTAMSAIAATPCRWARVGGSAVASARGGGVRRKPEARASTRTPKRTCSRTSGTREGKDPLSRPQRSRSKHQPGRDDRVVTCRPVISGRG